jgi:hypothetical protein
MRGLFFAAAAVTPAMLPFHRPPRNRQAEGHSLLPPKKIYCKYI